jgi:hypothetical protein
MTHEEALTEAQRRWGGHAIALHRPSTAGTPGIFDFVVGAGGARPMFNGDSWEAAFAYADRRTTLKEEVGSLT